MNLFFFLLLAVPILAETTIEHPVAEHQNTEKLDEKPVGLNTVETDEEGNWLLKKLWWQEAQKAFTDLQAINDKLLPIQLSFLTIKNNSEREFDTAWVKLGFDDENLIDNLKSIQERISAEKELRSGDLSEAEREDLTKIESLEKETADLKESLEKMAQYQFKIDDVLKDVVTHLKTCRQYETKAWANLQKIAQTLDDQKARELYLQIEVDLKNAKNMAKYLEKDLKDYVNSIVNEQAKTLTDIKDKVKALEKEGYSLTKDVTEFVKEDKALAQEREKAHQEALKKAAEKKKKGFWGSLWNKVYMWFR